MLRACPIATCGSAAQSEHINTTLYNSTNRVGDAMTSSDGDEDLELAMALSIQQSPSAASTNKVVVDLTSDREGEDDEDLKRAIVLSLRDNVQLAVPIQQNADAMQKESDMTRTAQTAELTQQAPKSTSGKPQALPMTTSFAWNRKAMEQERLARLEKSKRKRSPSPDEPSKHLSQTSVPAASKGNSAGHQQPAGRVLRYPKGVIKRTFATKFPRTNDLTVDELLEASSLKIAVISSFQWDEEWLRTKLDYTKVRQIWVMNAKGAELQAQWRQDLADTGIPNLRVHFPPLEGATMNTHSKYMLLFHDDKLRVVVTTANMEREYWGEVKSKWQPGVMENSSLVIDLPRRADGVVGSKDELSLFGKELVHFLEAQKLDSDVINGVLKFDFSQTGHLAFVHSMYVQAPNLGKHELTYSSGAPTDTESHPTGLPSLARAVRDLDLDKVESIELDYAASSLGALTFDLLQRIYLAAQGLLFTSAPTSRTKMVEQLTRRFRIYYPSDDTIKSSIGGPNCAGIISLRKSHFLAPTFPGECVRDHVSTRKGMISHNKLLFARGRHADGTGFAWVYVGSANISESAWGAQKILKSGKMGKLTIRNWECGVVFPVPEEKFKALRLEKGEVPPMSVFEDTIEVPFQIPGEAYEGRSPWLQNF